MSAFSQVTGTVMRRSTALWRWAKISDDHRAPDGDGWVVLLDPAGNEFCLTRSAAERQP
jgi:hypothetical protein